MAVNYDVAGPPRPAGGAWSSATELIEYVRLELARGVTPSGQRIVSEQNLLKRRQPYAQVGEFRKYGMGLGIESRYGIRNIDHGGCLLATGAKCAGAGARRRRRHPHQLQRGRAARGGGPPLCARAVV